MVKSPPLMVKIIERYFSTVDIEILFRRSNFKTFDENDMLLLCRKGLSNLKKNSTLLTPRVCTVNFIILFRRNG